ncbi:MAG: N-6 DNA methylase [Saprospiraceae bacterium]|nr:N-6 DNA methylase [Saprospiraceae bacterium]
MPKTNKSEFTQFLEKLGYNPAGKDVGRFVYCLEINQNQKTEIEFVFASNATNFKTKTYEEHRRIWNSNSSSAFVVVSETETILINPKVKPDESNPFRGKIESFEAGIRTEVDQKTQQWLSSKQINAGYFFEFVREKTKQNKKEQEVDKDLLLNLIALRLDLSAEKDSEAVADLLILRSLFLKYLEDRGIYPKGFVSKVLSTGRQSELLQAFDSVGKINGDIFKNEPLSEADFSSKQMQDLNRFFNSDYRSGQGTLFPYEFQHIPIQLISHVYEAFLNDSKKHGKGIYYTPQFIVRFMLEETLSPILVTDPDVAVMDPACGSGAFLVESFRKIVQAKHVQFDFNEKKRILEKQIFGIDNDGQALRIAAFSLYLALLEDLDAGFIRQQIEDNSPILPSLIGKNLLYGNTITDDHLFKDKTFGCIVGNPPWGSVPEDDNNEHQLERRAIGEKGKVGSKAEYQSVSTFQRSQAFIFSVSKWLSPDAIVGLIVNNSNFLNENAELFRRTFLQKYKLISFFELSHLNPILFKKKTIGIVKGEKIEVGATEPAAFLVFSKENKAAVQVKYVAPRLTALSKHLNLVHFTQRDVRIVPQSVLLEDDLAWKVLVNGDWDDLALIREKIAERDLEYDIECKSGFKPLKNMGSIGEPHYRPLIRSEDFDSYYLKENLTFFNWNQTLGRRRDEKIFEGSKILIAFRPKPEDKLRLRCIRTSNNEIFKNDVSGIYIKKGQRQVSGLAPF